MPQNRRVTVKVIPMKQDKVAVPVNISIIAIMKCLKYIKISKLYISNDFIVENHSGKLIF